MRLSGEADAGKDVVQVALPDASSGCAVQPVIGCPPVSNATVPVGVADPDPATVAVSVTDWPDTELAGLGLASAVVVGVMTFAVTEVAV